MQIKTYELSLMAGSHVDMIARLPVGAQVLETFVKPDHLAGPGTPTIKINKFFVTALVNVDAPVEVRYFSTFMENVEQPGLEIVPMKYIGKLELDTETTIRHPASTKPVYYLFEMRVK